MHVVIFLTGILLSLSCINAQYTVIPTVISWSESSWYSYYSTQTITYITTVPCPVFTTSITLTTWNCPEHCDTTSTQTICSPASCDDNGAAVETTYNEGDIAPALVTGGPYSYPTNIPADQCTATAAFVTDGDTAGLPACSPIVDVVCIASPCLTFSNKIIYTEINSVSRRVTSVVPSTSFADYSSGQNALVSGNPPYATPAASCYYFTSPTDESFGTVATAQCPTSIGGVNGEAGGATDTCAGSVVTYSYTTSGAEVVETTTLGGRCISFSGAGNRMETTSFDWLVWLWFLAAIFSGIGMIVL